MQLAGGFFFVSSQFILFSASVLLWVLGGTLIGRSVFLISARENLVIGLGLGSSLIIVLTNLASHWLNLQWAYSLATAILFGMGVVLSVIPRPKRDIFDGWLLSIPPLFALLLLFALFLRINQGLAIFDENYNLPIISRIAAGDAPPHFPFDPNQPLAYHYGLHLLAGVAVRLGGISPWLAFDAVRAFTHALLIVLAALWFYRQTNQFWASVLGAGFVYLAGSTQWLLVFLPLPWLDRLNQAINLTNTAVASGSALYEVLLSQWKIDGLGPISYPFAFVNAIFKPQTLALTSNGAFVGVALCLLLLLDRAEDKKFQNLVISLILASIALTAEYLFGMLALGSLSVLILEALHKRSFALLPKAAQVWLPALLLAFTAGGVLSVLIQQRLAQPGASVMESSNSGLQFTWLWPPSLSTLYFGKLSLFRWETLLLSFVLIGPLLILFPLSAVRLNSSKSADSFLERSILFGSWLSFALGLLVGIRDSEGGITRLLDTALLGILILSIPALYRLWLKGRRSLQSLLAVWSVMVCVSGLLTLGINLIAVVRPQTTYYLRGLDLMFYQRYWNRLDANAQVFDPMPVRALVLFGRSVGSIASDYNQWLPEWQELLENPLPTQLIRAGYTHAYLDKRFWGGLTPASQSAWDRGCVRLIEEQTLDFDFRRLYDLQACR